MRHLTAIRHILSVVFLAMSCALSIAVPAHAQDTSDDTLNTLLETLKDDAARAALISELETLAEAQTPTFVVEDILPDVGESVSIGRRIALFTQDLVESTTARALDIWSKLTNSDNVFAGLNGSEFQVLIDALPNLFLVILITMAVYLILRRFAIPVYRRMGHRANDMNAVATIFMFIGSNVLDVLIVVLSWGLGYLFTVLAVGDFGEIGIRQTMYLNAFLIVELAKSIVRIVLAPNSAGLRPFPIATAPAKSLYRTLSIVVSILGYGQLLVVPIINRSASVAAGSGVAALLYLAVLCYLIVIVLRKRDPVAQWMTGIVKDPVVDVDDDTKAEAFEATQGAPQLAPQQLAPQQLGWLARFWVALAHRWHWFALIYLAGMFVLVMTQSNEVVFMAALASGKVIAVVVLASLVSSALTGAMRHGISLPDDWDKKLPLLEPRLNKFLRRVFGLVRFAIIFIASLVLLNVLDIIDLTAWATSNFGLAATKIAVSVSAILAVAFCIWLAMTSWVDYRLNPQFGSVATSREVTLLTLMRNAATIVIVVLALMFSLSEIGLNIGPLLASAGVLGLAIGFGAQSMVQDIITGVFIQFENAMNVGDIVNVNGTTGTVEKLSVRSVSLRDVNGTVHLIPFSSVDMVSNFSRDFAYFVCDMGVAYRENIEEVREAMLLCFEQLKDDETQGAFVIDDLEWFGVQSFGDSAVVLRARIKTQPGKQFGVGRAYNGYLKTEFDARNIEIPFPHQTIFFGEAKDGKTQPIQVEGLSALNEVSS